jgi:hypothetical protein
MAKGSTAVLHYDRQVVRCANLSDHHLNSVKVVFGKYFRDVDPGREIILVRDGAGDIGKLALGESIGWRDLNRIKLGDVHVFTIKVSTKDMLKSCLIYRQLSESPLEADHRLKDELLKSAAALETMYNKKKGPFELSPYKQGHPGEEPSMQTAESGNSNQG